jgi:hypothetical protein
MLDCGQSSTMLSGWRMLSLNQHLVALCPSLQTRARVIGTFHASASQVRAASSPTTGIAEQSVSA